MAKVSAKQAGYSYLSDVGRGVQWYVRLSVDPPKLPSLCTRNGPDRADGGIFPDNGTDQQEAS